MAEDRRLWRGRSLVAATQEAGHAIANEEASLSWILVVGRGRIVLHNTSELGIINVVDV